MAQIDAPQASHALLLVGHGSRDADGQREFLAFAAMDLLFEREREALAGMVHMNCDACKWRRAGLAQEHGHGHAHAHGHSHGRDPYVDLQGYHERIWKPL